MALVEKYHVVAADRAVAVAETIKEGQIVSLNEAGEVVLQGATYSVPYGIAGDTKSTSASSMPGISSGWQNRASEYYDETRASGLMTVYHSGGEFASDQFVAGVASLTPGAPLYAVSGMLSNVDTQSSGVVARVTEQAGLLPSGVPGVDINGDIALGSEQSNDTYVHFKLII